MELDTTSIKNLASFLRDSQNITQGIAVHTQINRCGFHKNTFLANLLVQMYGRFGEMDSALAVFRSIPQRNLFSWTILLTAFSRNGDLAHSLRIFREMRLDGAKPDGVAIANVLGVCSRLRDLDEGALVHGEAIDAGLERESLVCNSLISMYGRCGSIEDAGAVFNRSCENGNIVAWNSMIKAYAENELFQEAIELYEAMPGRGIPMDAITLSTVLDICARTQNLAMGTAVHKQIEISKTSGIEFDPVVLNSLLTMYGKCGSLDDARKIFESLRRRDPSPSRETLSKNRKHKIEIIHWNAMISAYAQNSREQNAIQLYKSMLCDGICPDVITLVAVLGACSCSSRFLRDGRAFHCHVRERGFDSSEASVTTTLIHMYGSLGCTEEAQAVFDSCPKSLTSWNAWIAANAATGHWGKAMELFRRMDNQGVKMDEVTYINALNACSCLKAGRSIYLRAREFGFDSSVVLGTSAINMFGRCGSIIESRAALLNLKDQVNVVSWTALITAHTQNGHYGEAIQLYLDPLYGGLIPDRVTFVSVVEACTALGALKEGREIHRRARALGFDRETVLGNAIVDMYAKCGSLIDAMDAFGRIATKSAVSWNIAIRAQAQAGNFDAAIGCAGEMALEGVDLDETSVIGVLVACSHAGTVDRACQCFLSIGQDFGLSPTVDHFVCMIDALGRAGKIAHAEMLLDSMPFLPDYIALVTLLYCCCLHSNFAKGVEIAQRVFEMKPEVGGPFVLMDRIFRSMGKLEEASLCQEKCRKHG